MNDPYTAGEIDAQREEIKRISGCVTMLASIITLVSVIFFIWAYGHTH